ncbi:hypothetical protein ACR9GP_25265 [Enterobacter ludwigii]
MVFYTFEGKRISVSQDVSTGKLHIHILAGDWIHSPAEISRMEEVLYEFVFDPNSAPSDVLRHLSEITQE